MHVWGRIENLGLHFTDIYLPALAGLLIYLLILMAFRWWMKGRFENIIRFVYLIMALLIFFTFRRIELLEPQLCVYDAGQYCAIGIFGNTQAAIIGDNQLYLDSTNLEYKLKGHWLMRGAAKPVLMDIQSDTSDWFFAKKGPLILFNESYLLLSENDAPEISIAKVDNRKERSPTYSNRLSTKAGDTIIRNYGASRQTLAGVVLLKIKSNVGM